MRRHFLGKFLVFVAIIVVAIVGLSALIGGLFFRGGGAHRGPFFPIGIVVIASWCSSSCAPAAGSRRRSST